MLRAALAMPSAMSRDLRGVAERGIDAIVDGDAVIPAVADVGAVLEKQEVLVKLFDPFS